MISWEKTALASIFDCELANAVQGITTSLSAIKTFTQFEAYYVMSDMNWYDCIKSHHKVLDKLKLEKKMEKRKETQREIQDRIEKEGDTRKNKRKRLDRIV